MNGVKPQIVYAIPIFRPARAQNLNVYEMETNIARLKNDPPKKQPIKLKSIFPSYE